MSWGWSWAGIALFRLVDGVPEVFLARRAIRLQRGQWSIPGGGVKDGESFLGAAFRELGEETMGKGRGCGGAVTREVVKPHIIGKMKRLLIPVPLAVTLIYGFLVQSMPRPFPTLNHENDQCGWFALDDLPQPLHGLLRLELRYFARRMFRRSGLVSPTGRTAR